MTNSSSNPFVFVSYPLIDKKIVQDLLTQAQTTYEQLPSNIHCLLARMLFLRLINFTPVEQNMVAVQPGRVFMTDLVFSNVEQSNRMREVISAFVDAKLLTTGAMNEKWFLTVSNEMLLQKWDLLHTWMNDEGLDALHLQRRISTAATDWHLHGRVKEGLYRGKFLQEALLLVQKTQLNEIEEEFIKASVNAQGAQFNMEVMKIAGIGAGLVTAGFAVFGKMQTETQLHQAKYWRNRNQREVNKLKKALKKHQ